MKFRTFRRQCCSLKCKLLVLLPLVIVLSVYYMVSHISFQPDVYYLSNPSFLGLDKCPACYGKSLCHKFKSGNLTFTWLSKYRILDNLNIKNVHYALLDNSTSVMIKRLAHDIELQRFDEEICDMAGMDKNCNVSLGIYKTKFATDETHIPPHLTTNLSDLMRCPSQRLLDLGMEYSQEKIGRLFTLEERLQFIYTSAINPEPLVMQMFNTKSKEIWSFPQYIGACGRMVVEQYVGPTLDKIYSRHWEERIDYAYQILKIADHLTNNDLGFGIYWTDVSYDNFAVNSDGKVIVIDLENLIVTDKAKIRREMKPGWNVPYHSSAHKCPNYGDCLSFSIADLCTSYDVDLNYYAACHNLLSSHAKEWGMPSGILHDLPDEVNQRWNITGLVEACANPEVAQERFDIVRKLMDNLEQLRLNVF